MQDCFGYDTRKFNIQKFEITISVSTMWCYKDAPSKGHLGAMIIIFGYLKNHMHNGIICDIIVLGYQGDIYLKINWLDL